MESRLPSLRGGGQNRGPVWWGEVFSLTYGLAWGRGKARYYTQRKLSLQHTFFFVWGLYLPAYKKCCFWPTSFSCTHLFVICLTVAIRKGKGDLAILTGHQDFFIFFLFFNAKQSPPWALQSKRDCTCNNDKQYCNTQEHVSVDKWHLAFLSQLLRG